MELSTAIAVAEFLESYNQHFLEIVLFLSEKQKRVIEDDLIWLMESLVTEQKLIMRGNSLEAKRLTLFDELDIKDITSKELIKKSPEEIKGRLKLSCTGIEEHISHIKRLNATILDLVDRKLSFQSELVSKTGYSAEDTYTGSGMKVSTRGFGGIIADV